RSSCARKGDRRPERARAARRCDRAGARGRARFHRPAARPARQGKGPAGARDDAQCTEGPRAAGRVRGSRSRARAGCNDDATTVNAMRFFDPHIHMTSRTTDDFEAMAKAGVRAVIEPAFWLGQPRTQVGTFVDYYSSLVGWERFR